MPRGASVLHRLCDWGKGQIIIARFLKVKEFWRGYCNGLTTNDLCSKSHSKIYLWHTLCSWQKGLKALKTQDTICLHCRQYEFLHLNFVPWLQTKQNRQCSSCESCFRNFFWSEAWIKPCGHSNIHEGKQWQSMGRILSSQPFGTFWQRVMWRIIKQEDFARSQKCFVEGGGPHESEQ